MEEENPQSQVPFYFDMLSEDDKRKYNELKSVLAAPDHRYNRNKRIVTFTDMLDQIKKFCEKGDNDDWKRFLVCGICWLNKDIAINTRQLRVILGKSKSTINGALSKMGYETLPLRRHDTNNALLNRIPFLNGNFTEARQWTVRRNSQVCVSDCIQNDEPSPEPQTEIQTNEHEDFSFNFEPANDWQAPSELNDFTFDIDQNINDGQDNEYAFSSFDDSSVSL